MLILSYWSLINAINALKLLVENLYLKYIKIQKWLYIREISMYNHKKKSPNNHMNNMDRICNTLLCDITKSVPKQSQPLIQFFCFFSYSLFFISPDI